MKNANYKVHSFDSPQGERGASLIVSILSLLLVTLLGFGLMSLGYTGRTVTTNDIESAEAFSAAEAGLQHSFQIFAVAGRSNFEKFLRNGDDNALWDEMANGDQINTIVDPIPSTGRVLGGTQGRYRISVTDDAEADGNLLIDTNYKLLVTAEATGRNGSTATIEAVFGYVPRPGMLVQGNLRLNGNPDIVGEGGSVHANGTLDLDGTPCVAQYISSTAPTIIDANRLSTSSGCKSDARPNRPNIPVPDYNVANWASDPDIPDPDIIFRPDGVVLKRATGLPAVTTGTGTNISHPSVNITGSALPAPAGYVPIGAACATTNCSGGEFVETLHGVTVRWAFDGAADRKLWSLSGNDLHGGRTYYVQGGNLSISGSPGSSSTPKIVTFLADGYIDLSGNPFITEKDSNVQMMAGTDIKISGNTTGSEVNMHGLHFARHQISFAGNPTITGQVIARNFADTQYPGPPGQNIVPRSADGYMAISGNPRINYDGGGFTNLLKIMNWREVRK